MSDNKLYAIIWLLGAMTISVIAISVSSYHKHKNAVRAAMVADGVEPLMVNCVIEDEHNTSTKCILATAGKYISNQKTKGQ